MVGAEDEAALVWEPDELESEQLNTEGPAKRDEELPRDYLPIRRTWDGVVVEVLINVNFDAWIGACLGKLVNETVRRYVEATYQSMRPGS